MKILSFHNKRFEQAVRESLNRPSGPIFDTDAPSVKTLDCNFSFDVEDVPVLRSFRNLASLYIETDYSNCDAIRDAFFDMTNMEVIDVCWKSGDLDFHMFQNMRQLTHFFITGGDISCMDLLHPEVLVEMKQLHTVSLHEFGSVDLAFLESMPQLRSFFCGYADHVDHPDAISSLIHLEDLTLVDIKLKDLRFLDTLPDSLELELLACEFPQMIDLKSLDRFRHVDLNEIIIMGEEQLPYEHWNKHEDNEPAQS